MRGQKRADIQPRQILVAAVILCLAILYFRYDPALEAFFPKCPFKLITGLDCPGCGAQRAVHALLHGKIIDAAGYNLAVIVGIAAFSAKVLIEAWNFFFPGTKKQLLSIHPKAPWIVLAAVSVFWILRNIPFAPFDLLAA